MSPMTAVIPHGRPFTVTDLQAMPDDGNRYELIDGMLVVTPAPRPVHQLALGEQLQNGVYAQVAHVVGDEPFTARRPFPVTITPARLFDGTRP